MLHLIQDGVSGAFYFTTTSTIHHCLSHCRKPVHQSQTLLELASFTCQFDLHVVVAVVINKLRALLVSSIYTWWWQWRSINLEGVAR